MRVSKLVTFILNIALAIVCCAAIAGYIAGPVWEIKATVTINQDVIDKIAEMTSTDTSDESDPIVGILKQMSVDDVKLPVTLSLSSKAVYRSLFDKDGSSVDNLIDEAVEAAFNDEVIAEAEKLKKSAAKGATKSLVASAMEELKNTDEYKDEFGDKSVEEVLAEAGIDDKTFDEKVEIVYDALTGGNSVDKASDEIVDVIADIFDTVKESDLGKENPELFEKFDIYDGELKDNVIKTLVCLLENADGNTDVKSLDDVTDEMVSKRLDSTIDLSDVIDKYILQLINGDFGDVNVPDSTAEANKNNGVLPAFSVNFAIDKNAPVNLSDRFVGESTNESGNAPNAGTADETEGSSVEEIKATVKQKLKDSVSDEGRSVFVIVMRVLAVILVLWMLVWVYLLVKLIVNTVTGKMSTKLKSAVIFGWGPALLIVVVPTLIFRLFTTNNFIIQAIFANNLAALESFSQIVTLSFSSGTILAFIATLAVIAISIPYMIFRKK